MCGEVSPCFHPGVRAQHSQGLVRAAQSNSHLLVYPPEWAAGSPCQALGGSSWHRELCWAFAGKTENLPSGNSCVECFLCVLTINHCTELQPDRGSGRRVLVTTPGVSSGGVGEWQWKSHCSRGRAAAPGSPGSPGCCRLAHPVGISGGCFGQAGLDPPLPAAQGPAGDPLQRIELVGFV